MVRIWLCEEDDVNVDDDNALDRDRRPRNRLMVDPDKVCSIFQHQFREKNVVETEEPIVISAELIKRKLMEERVMKNAAPVHGSRRVPMRRTVVATEDGSDSLDNVFDKIDEDDEAKDGVAKREV